MTDDRKFLNWLSSRVSPSKLVRYSNALTDLDAFCHEQKLIQESLLDTRDLKVVAAVQREVDSNRIFRVRYSKKRPVMKKALSYLTKYLRKQNSAMQSLPTPEVAKPSTSPLEQKAPEQMSLSHAEKSDATLVVNFDTPAPLAFTKPVSLSYFGDTYQESAWKQIFVRLLRLLADDYPKKFNQLVAEESSELSLARTDSSTARAMRYPLPVCDDILVETNFSADTLVRRMRFALDYCLVDYENVVVLYRVTETAVSQEMEVVETVPTLPAHTPIRQSEILPPEKISNDWIKFDFHNADAFAYTYPAYVCIGGNTFSGKNWVQLLRAVTEDALIRYPDKMEKLKIRPLLERGHTPFLLKERPGYPNYSMNAYQLSNGYWIRVGYPIPLLVTTLARLCQFLEYKDDEILIYGITKGFYQVSMLPSVKEPADGLQAELEKAGISGPQLAVLRDALSEARILTKEQLEQLDLWDFLNKRNLFSIGARQKICQTLTDYFHPKETLAPELLYQLHTGDKTFTGRTVALAFRRFCEALAVKYPLTFRTMVGIRRASGEPMLLLKDGDNEHFLRMTSPPVYIPVDISIETLLPFVKWMLRQVGQGNLPLSCTPPIFVEPAPSAVQTLPITQVKTAVLDADLDGISLKALADQLGITVALARKAVEQTPEIMEIGHKLIHEDALVDWEEARDQLERILEKLLEKNDGYLSAAQFYDYVRMEMRMFLNDNDLDDKDTVYALARHLFEKQHYHGKIFHFSGGTHISRNGQAVTNVTDLVKKYVDSQDGFFRLKDLSEYLKSKGFSGGNPAIYLKLRSEPNYFYYNEEYLLAASEMNMDDAWFETLGKALDILMADVGDHVILRSIHPGWFRLLPPLPAQRPWTLLLLQSILAFYGKRYHVRTIGAPLSQAYTTLHAMLVTEDSEVQTFADAVAALLVDNRISKRQFGAEELRVLLVTNGLAARNELIYNMPKVLADDPRFIWDLNKKDVAVHL